MKIAVAYENGEVFQHFGHTEHFKFYDVEGDHILASEVVGTDGNGHSALADFLTQHHVDVLLCGGIGGGAKQALSEAGIELYGGVFGNADQAVKDFLSGKLHWDPETICQHHEAHHGSDCEQPGHCSHHCHT